MSEIERERKVKPSCMMFPRVFSRRKSQINQPKSQIERNSHKNSSKSNLKPKKLQIKKIKKINQNPENNGNPKSNKSSLAERLEILQKMLPQNLPPIAETVENIIFKKSVAQACKDAPRLIHKVILQKRLKGKNTEVINFNDLDCPENLVTTKHPIWLLMQLMTELVNFHEKSSVAKKSISAMNKVYEEFLKNGGKENDNEFFTVETLLKAQGGDETKTALTIKCLAQGITIAGHTLVKTQVSPLPTKDHSWDVVITLAEFVQVKHCRREKSKDGDRIAAEKWEIQYDVSITFDKKMAITAVNCAITDLVLGEEIDPELRDYLLQKFGNGKLSLC